MGIKINADHRTSESAGIKQKGKDIDKADTVKTSFGSQLKKMSETNYEQRLQKLLENINDQGEKVVKTKDLREVLRYKNMITEFLSEVTRESHAFERQNFLDRRGRHRTYGIIKKVNSTLDELAQEVLKKEKDNIRILQKVDDIRGMLVDLYM